MNKLSKLSFFAALVLVASTSVCAQGLTGLQNGRRPALLNRGPAGRLGGTRSQQTGTTAAAAGQSIGTDGDKSFQQQIADMPKGTNGVPESLAVFAQKAAAEFYLLAYADAVGKILLPSPNLPKVEISLIPPTDQSRPMTKDEYLQMIEVALTMHGIVIEEFGDIFLRAYERKSVRTQGIRTSMDIPAEGIREKGRVISQLIRLNHISFDEAQKAVEGLKAPETSLLSFERNNSILVTDTQENVNRMLEIIKELDVPNPSNEEVFSRQIQFAVASEIKTMLMDIITESQKDLTPQQAKSGPKESGAPGFGRAAPQPPAVGRLLNLNRPGNKPPEPAPVTPNASMTANVSDADRGMIRGKVIIEADDRSNKLIVITSKSNMDFFDKVIETLDVETTPEVSVEVIRLKYADAEEVASMLNDLIGNNSSSQSKNNTNANAAKNGTGNKNLTTGGNNRPGAAGGRAQTANPTFSRSASASLGELNKDNIKILDDKRINGIVIMARRADMKAVKEVIEDMDVKLSQVLLETVIIQVELGNDLTTGIDWIKTTKQKSTWGTEQVGTGKYSEQLTGYEAVSGARVDEDGKIVDKAGEELKGAVVGPSGNIYKGLYEYKELMTSIPKKLTDSKQILDIDGNGSMLGGGGGSAATTLNALMQGAAAVGTNGAADAIFNPAGTGLNYLLKSKKLNIAAILQASAGDSRTKVLASPILMTVDNKEATIEATDMIYLFSGYQYSGSSMYGSQVRNYEKRDIGLTVKVTPKINPNGTVMLNVEQTFETQGADQIVPGENGQKDPYATVTTRKISSDVSVENRQTIVMGGLTKKTNVESESGIPILKDIPWIGKWLFSSVSQKEARSELLVFMTPYVLDDADAAQAEAFRRKRALSDPRPWEDNGWSASPIADPMSKKEQLRRLNEEWKKQDEERQNKRAVEEAKEKRAQKLREMDEDDRKAWAKRHEKEIEREIDRFNDEQKDLREIIDGIRERHEKAAAEAATTEAEAVEPGSEGTK